MSQTTEISGRKAFVAIAVVLFASPLVATAAQVDFNLNGVGIGGSLDGVYTSPYQAIINHTGGSVPVICDDFANNSYVPEDWTANVTSLSSIMNGTDTPGDLKWNSAVSGGSVDGYAAWNLGNQMTAYDVAAYLAIEIMTCGTGADPDSNCTVLPSTTSEQLSYAFWELFDARGSSSVNPNLPSNSDQVVSWLTSPSPNADSGTLSAATIDVENAINAVCGASNCTTTGGVTTLNNNVTVNALAGYNVNIYTVDPSDPITCNGGSCGSTPPQEFVTVGTSSGMTYHSSLPESSSFAALGGYFLFGGASLLFLGRRRLLRSDS